MLGELQGGGAGERRHTAIKKETEVSRMLWGPDQHQGNQVGIYTDRYSSGLS